MVFAITTISRKGRKGREELPFAIFAVFACIVVSEACRSRTQQPPARDVILWHQVGAWAGRGDKQTEAFTGDTGGFRVTWETKNETVPGAGRLKVVFRSGDSGREIVDAIDARGVGRDVAYVAAERPRWYYLTIESANVDWSITVEEEIRGQIPAGPSGGDRGADEFLKNATTTTHAKAAKNAKKTLAGFAPFA